MGGCPVFQARRGGYWAAFAAANPFSYLLGKVTRTKGERMNRFCSYVVREERRHTRAHAVGLRERQQCGERETRVRQRGEELRATEREERRGEHGV